MFLYFANKRNMSRAADNAIPLLNCIGYSAFMQVILSFFLIFLCSAGIDQNIQHIVFLGDSLTDGYTLGKHISYPALIQKRIKKKNLPYLVVNAGVSGNTTQDALARLNSLLEGDIAVFVVALGANDGLRDVAAEKTEENLRKILKSVHAHYPDAKLVVAAPGNIGVKSSKWPAFKAVFPRVAAEFGALYIESLLEGVSGNPSLTMPDGLHPNVEGQKVIAAQMWSVLRGYIESETNNHKTPVSELGVGRRAAGNKRWLPIWILGMVQTGQLLRQDNLGRIT